MTIRILNPLDWSMAVGGQFLHLNGDHDRIVKIELNTDAPMRVDLFQFDDEGVERKTFLGVISGIDKIEVAVSASATIGFDGDGEVWWFSNDGVATVVENDGEASFTKMVGRKTRSEQLEHIIQMQQISMNRLVVAQESERAARELAEEQLAAAAEREAAKPAPASGVPGATEQQVPAPIPAPAAAGETPSPSPEPSSIST